MLRVGRRLKGEKLNIVYLAPEGHRHQTRIAAVVSKKISKHAPVRNRLRRQIYAHMRSLQDALPPGTDIVIIARPPCDPNLDVAGEINALIAKIR